MSLAIIHSRALVGLAAPAVRVEVHLANGLPSFALVGLAETEVKEARERVRAALSESGQTFPHNRRITVNLAPADLPKESGRFDLPIALGILAAQGLLDLARLAQYEFAGELSLAGELRPVRGALALALGAAQAQTARALVLPLASASDAARVGGLRVYGAATLSDVVQAFVPEEATPTGVPAAGLIRPVAPERVDPAPTEDLADVRGQAAAKRALEIAAAGGHGLLMSGPPGSGKSMLARRLAGLLPPMSDAHALESAALWSLAQPGFEPARFGQRPLRAPHHTASAVALVGGGSPPRPGEISLAHMGVLFLDELPEFPRMALEALREPLENGWITISRAGHQARFPARFQLVAAMNPCPCGWLGSEAGAPQLCRCTPDRVRRYQERLSGPLLDRMDLCVEVPRMPPQDVLGLPRGEPSSAVRQRVQAARERQLSRQGEPNAWLSPRALDEHSRLTAPAQALLTRAAAHLGWTGRSLHRVIRIARSIADLASQTEVDAPAVAEAIQYRRGPTPG